MGRQPLDNLIRAAAEPVWIGDVPVHPLTLAETLRLVERACETGERAVIHYANAHAVNLAGRNEAFRDAMVRASLVFCDGKSLQWAARLLGRRLPERFTPPDWIDSLCAMSLSHGYSLYFLGAEKGVATGAAISLQQRHPGLRIESSHGYFDRSVEGSRAMVDRIHKASPEILLVGMGMPIQELWVRTHIADASIPVTITVGGMFDFISNYKHRGPQWLTNMGLEWLARLLHEPRRLGKRYLLGNPQFLWTVLRQALQERVGPRVADRG